MPESLLLEQYDAVGMVTSKFTTLLLQFQILCMPSTCKVINEILEFGSWRWVGGWEHRACIIYQPTQSNVPRESNLAAEQTDRF